MALIAIAADKGAPGVTTASVALAAVWPRPVLLAECDPAGGDLACRFPAAGGGRLDPGRGLLNLAVATRHGLQPHQVWEHSQKLHGGLDILAGVGGAEQGAGLELFWGAVGRVLAAVPQADVIADCGRLGADAPVYDLLAHAACVVLLSRPAVGEVIRLRDRVATLTVALQRRGRLSPRVGVVVVADHRNITSAAEEVGQALRQGGTPVRVIGGLAYEPKSAEQLRGAWGGRLDKSMFIRTARAIATDLAGSLPEPVTANGQSPVWPPRPAEPAAGPQPQPPAQAFRGRHAGAAAGPASPPASPPPGPPPDGAEEPRATAGSPLPEPASGPSRGRAGGC